MMACGEDCDFDGKADGGLHDFEQEIGCREDLAGIITTSFFAKPLSSCLKL